MGKLMILAGSYVMSSIILKIFSAIGLSLVTYKVIDSLVNELISRISEQLNSLPSDILQIFSISGIFTALSIICSAILTATAIRSAKVFFKVAS